VYLEALGLPFTALAEENLQPVIRVYNQPGRTQQLRLTYQP